MSNNRTPIAQGYHKRLILNRASHRSLSRSRKSVRFNDVHRSSTRENGSDQISLLNSNDKTQRRTSSASSLRSHIRSDVSLQKPTTEQTTATNDLSCQILQEQITSLSQVSLSITEPFEIPIEQITRQCIVWSHGAPK